MITFFICALLLSNVCVIIQLVNVKRKNRYLEDKVMYNHPRIDEIIRFQMNLEEYFMQHMREYHW